jgi:hypothetical protein
MLAKQSLSGLQVNVFMGPGTRQLVAGANE